MVVVTILGAGVTGLTIASQLPTDYDITIVGKFLPGDPLSKDWASPWAGGCWVGVHASSPRDRAIQLQAFGALWNLASLEDPASGLRITKMTEIQEYGNSEDVWYSNIMPGFRMLDKSEMPEQAKLGMTYQTVAISPPVFLSWMRSRLEARGVHFQRRDVESLADLRVPKQQIVINAAGAQSRNLVHVADNSLVPYRLQSILIKSDYPEAYIYRGLDDYYFNVFGRGDGTTYIGGIKTYGSSDRSVYEKDRLAIISRGHKLLPSILPSPDPADYPIVYDIATTYAFRPQNMGGVRIEGQMLNGQRVIHAYGQEAGGYTYSFGVARRVAELAMDYASELPLGNKL